jgi:hypothetical protein
MAINWARLAWTFAFIIIGMMALFVFDEYLRNFRERYGDIKVGRIQTSSKTGETPKKPERPARTRKSRKYRARK